MSLAQLLRETIRDIPDFPKPGILFRDITPLLADPNIFREIIKSLAAAAPANLTHVAAIEARGFFFGISIAMELGLPFVPIRKKGKLCYQTVCVEYELEYGTDSVCIHTDAVEKDSSVYLIDDLIATGGTLAAAVQLLETCQAKVAKVACVIELADLKGRQKIPTTPFESLVSFSEQ